MVIKYRGFLKHFVKFSTLFDSDLNKSSHFGYIHMFQLLTKTHRDSCFYPQEIPGIFVGLPEAPGVTGKGLKT